MGILYRLKTEYISVSGRTGLVGYHQYFNSTDSLTCSADQDNIIIMDITDGAVVLAVIVGIPDGHNSSFTIVKTLKP